MAEEPKPMHNFIRKFIKVQPPEPVLGMMRRAVVESNIMVIFDIPNDVKVPKIKNMAKYGFTALGPIEARELAASLHHKKLAMDIETLNVSEQVIVVLRSPKGIVCSEKVSFHRNDIKEQILAACDMDAQPEIVISGLKSAEEAKILSERVLLYSENSTFSLADHLWQISRTALRIRVDVDMRFMSNLDKLIIQTIDELVGEKTTNRWSAVYDKTRANAHITCDFIKSMEFADENRLESCASAVIVECPFFLYESGPHDVRVCKSYAYSTFVKP